MKVQPKILKNQLKEIKQRQLQFEKEHKDKLVIAQEREDRRFLPSNLEEVAVLDHGELPEVPTYDAEQIPLDGPPIVVNKNPRQVAMQGDWVLKKGKEVIVLHNDDFEAHWEEAQ